MKLIDLEYRRARRLVRARERATKRLARAHEAQTPLGNHMQRNLIYRFNLIHKLKVAWLRGTPLMCITLGAGSFGGVIILAPDTPPNGPLSLGVSAVIGISGALFLVWMIEIWLIGKDHSSAFFEDWQTSHRARLTERFEERQRIIARAVELSQGSKHAGAIELVSHAPSPRGKLTLIDGSSSPKAKYKRQWRTP